MNFEELKKAIGEQQVLAKSLSAAQVDSKGNANVAAAAAAGANSGATNPEDEDDNGNGNGDLGDGSPLIKSFKLILEDGTELEAADATEMVKALVTELENVKVGHAAHVDEMMKSFEGVVGVIGQLTEGLNQTRQDVLAIAAKNGELEAANALLTKSLGAVGGQGRGQRSVNVTLGARPAVGAAAAGANKGPSKQEILSKASDALSAGRITGTEAVKVQSAINMGAEPEKAILDRIFSN